jgi:hypothetical protein
MPLDEQTLARAEADQLNHNRNAALPPNNVGSRAASQRDLEKEPRHETTSRPSGNETAAPIRSIHGCGCRNLAFVRLCHPNLRAGLPRPNQRLFGWLLNKAVRPL